MDKCDKMRGTSHKSSVAGEPVWLQVSTQPGDDVFVLLDQFMVANNLSVEGLFEYFDRDNNGVLDGMELQRLVQKSCHAFSNDQHCYRTSWSGQH